MPTWGQALRENWKITNSKAKKSQSQSSAPSAPIHPKGKTFFWRQTGRVLRQKETKITDSGKPDPLRRG